MNQIDKVLAERGKRYGDFTDHAKIAQGLQKVMQNSYTVVYGDQCVSSERNWGKLDDVQRQALTVIADKIARILSGDPNYDDNWIDIQGYAKLAQDRLPKQLDLFDKQPTAEKSIAISKAEAYDLRDKLQEHFRSERLADVVKASPLPKDCRFMYGNLNDEE